LAYKFIKIKKTLMPKFAANLTLLFTDRPFLERFEAAAQAGFAAVECQFPYVHSAPEVAAALQRSGLPLVLHNLPAGDWAAGDRGLACDPQRVAEFHNSLPVAMEYAQALGAPRLNCLVGLQPTHCCEAEAWHTTVRNAKVAARLLATQGLELVLEPINTHDVPGFLISRTDDMLRLMDEIDQPNVKLQFDVYHATRMGEDVLATLERVLPRIGHIQIADAPARHEPGTGLIDFATLFKALDDWGYTGWVGCEYHPANTGPLGTEAGLGWRQRLGF
jgi:hydroxypyruvate isomerase